MRRNGLSLRGLLGAALSAASDIAHEAVAEQVSNAMPDRQRGREHSTRRRRHDNRERGRNDTAYESSRRREDVSKNKLPTSPDAVNLSADEALGGEPRLPGTVTALPLPAPHPTRSPSISEAYSDLPSRDACQPSPASATGDNGGSAMSSRQRAASFSLSRATFGERSQRRREDRSSTSSFWRFHGTNS